jgi:hypothetical protein
MRRKTKKRMASCGRREAAWRGAAFAPKRAVATAKHLAWAAGVAQRFGVRSALRGFAKATLTDLATHEVIRTKSRIASVVLRYDQRQWIHNEVQNFVTENHFRSKQAPVRCARADSESGASERVHRGYAERRESQISRTPLFVNRVLHSKAIVRRTAQVKSVELPLVLAGTRVSRRTGAGNVAIGDTDEPIGIAMPVTKVVRRHRRLEVARDRASNEFGVMSSLQSFSGPAVELEQLAAPVRVQRKTQNERQEPSAMGAGPLRGINVTQVADEVMKQLDRKLIAARERMGKI